MTDYFALLNQPRRPWLDADALKQTFLALSAEVHPDRVHSERNEAKRAASERFAQVNAAYNCLRVPKDRVLHLIELEAGRKPEDIQAIPPDMMNVLLEVGRLCREVDAFLGERARVTSPLLKVPLFERAQEWIEKLASEREKIEAMNSELLGDLKLLTAAWEVAPAIGSPERMASLPLQRLEEIYRSLSYTSRWLSQVHERVVQLSL